MTDGFTIDEDNYLRHYGILRKSGRYPWGSGGDELTRSRDFLGMVADLRKQGFSDTEIAKSFSTDDHPFTTTMLRASTTIARNQKRAADIAMAQRLKDKGYSNGAIAERMDLAGESSVRALLEPGSRFVQTSSKRLQICLRMRSILKGLSMSASVQSVTLGTRELSSTLLCPC